ncbi:outer dynein arm-docking complex subunit 4 [Erpetoichthys calabaricus]|uniref:outer dynein arm-docking complex subunit 4 n=1 Tax=Erpetoichthys calabaricus TaxID=27687 RepID=UPI002233F410|nr:outer dynein arm-docking complex subunit 4 [Erpetoichthys calabaricus]
MADDHEKEDQGPKCSFTIYMAEGDQLFLKGLYAKAMESFSNALALKPDDRICLVARSKCYLKMGDPESALKDAESSLKDDKEFFKGLYQKAEALYAMGDFEFALVFYHRGFQQRPEQQEFRLGIQKAQEAINNSVGSPSSVKLESKGDLTFFTAKEEVKKGKFKGPPKPQRLGSPQNEKTARQLLGELYTDKEYLEKLLKDKDLMKVNTRTGIKLQDLILGGISYLDTRTEFWRQQKPIYARVRDYRLMQQKWNQSKLSKISDPTDYILKNLEEIYQNLALNKSEAVSKKARQVLKTVQGWTDKEVPNKQEVIGNLYSCIGNAQIEMGDMDGALQSHEKDLEIAKQNNLMDAKSRALDNIGRVYARIGKFPRAIEVWEEKIPLTKSSLEKTWLFHEIGRCYLELNQNVKARSYGEKSLAFALEADNIEWQLHANVLMAQSEVKLGDYDTAVTLFKKALEKAEVLKDEATKEAIHIALEDVQKQIREAHSPEEVTEEADTQKDSSHVKEEEKKAATPLPESPQSLQSPEVVESPELVQSPESAESSYSPESPQSSDE